MNWNSTSTSELIDLFAANDNPDINKIRSYVRDKADVKAPSRRLQDRSVLEYVFCYGTAIQAETLLENVTSIAERSFFKAMCLNVNVTEMVHVVLSFFSSRRNNIRDVETFFLVFAQFGLLSVVFKRLEELPLTQHLGSNFSVCEMFQFDANFFAYCTVSKCIQLHCLTLWDDNKSTADLVRVLASNSPDPSHVQLCIEDNANLGFEHPYIEGTLLSFIMKNTSIECVKAVFHVTKPIDFTVPDKNGWSPLHAICTVSDTKDAEERLRLLVERVGRNPEDLVDFTQLTNNKETFFSLAAKHKRLFVFWPIVSSISSLDDLLEPILLCENVFLSDWSLLTTSNLNRFSPLHNIICDIDDKATPP